LLNQQLADAFDLYADHKVPISCQSHDPTTRLSCQLIP
jgi:hypothetical protein